MCAMDSHVKQALSTPGRVISPNHLVKNLRCMFFPITFWSLILCVYHKLYSSLVFIGQINWCSDRYLQGFLS